MRRLAQLSCCKIKVIFWQWHLVADCPALNEAMWMIKLAKDTLVSHTPLYHGGEKGHSIYMEIITAVCDYRAQSRSFTGTENEGKND